MTKYLYIFFIALFAFCSSFSEAKANGVYVSKEDVVNAIVEEFENQGVEDNIEIEFFGGQTNFSFEKGKSFKILVSSLVYDEGGSKFSCSLDIFVDEKHAQNANLQGRYFKIAEIYVPSININRGEIITEDMLKQLSVRQSKIKAGFVVEKEKIIGMEAKKSLKEGKMISLRDIGKQNIIKKGDLVNMHYSSSAMQIMAQGQAVTDAAEGDKIELLNTKSKKTVIGIVIDKDNVEVRQ